MVLPQKLLRQNRAGWVLAGGRSSRMGTDKALVELDGRPLAACAAEELSRVCGSVALVGDPATYSHLGLRVVPDKYPGLGPLAGIEAALGATEADLNIVVACDMPALHTPTLEALFALLIESGDCALPQHSDGKLEPLCAVYHRRCHPVFREALESGLRKVTDGLRHLESRGLALRYLRVDSPSAFANLNTPEELARHRAGRSPEGQHG